MSYPVLVMEGPKLECQIGQPASYHERLDRLVALSWYPDALRAPRSAASVFRLNLGKAPPPSTGAPAPGAACVDRSRRIVQSPDRRISHGLLREVKRLAAAGSSGFHIYPQRSTGLSWLQSYRCSVRACASLITLYVIRPMVALCVAPPCHSHSSAIDTDALLSWKSSPRPIGQAET